MPPWNFSFKKLITYRFGFYLLIPVAFILISLKMMDSVAYLRYQIQHNVNLINHFNSLEDDFRNIALEEYDVMTISDIKKFDKQVDRINSNFDSIYHFLNPGLFLVGKNIVKMDSIKDLVLNERQQMLNVSLVPLMNEEETKQIRINSVYIIDLIEKSVAITRQNMALLSSDLNKLWNKLFYLLIVACGIAIFLVIVLLLYRSQLYNRIAAQASLEESEQRNKALLDAIPDMLFRIDQNGTILDFKPSKEAEPLVTDANIVGKDISNFLPTDIAGEAKNRIDKALESGKSKSFEFDLHWQGLDLIFEARAITSGPNEVLVIVRNITKKKQAEKKIKESEAQLRNVTDSIPAMIAYVGKDLRYKFNNQAYERVFGIKREVIKGKPVSYLVGDKSFKESKKYLDEVLNGKPVRYQHFMNTKNKKIFIDVSLVPDIDEKGVVNGYYVTIIDITDLKETEEKLARSEAQWRSIFENVEDVIINIDRKGKILSMNHIKQGFTKEQVIGQNLFEFLPSFDKKRVKEGIFKVFDTREVYKYDVNFLGPDGTKIWYSSIATPIIKDNKVESVIIVTRDVTTVKEAEEAVMDAVIEGQDRERQRVSQELHDGLGQILSSIGINFDAVKRQLKGKTAPDQANIKNIDNLIKQSINEVRTISHNLMPDVLEEFGLAPAITNMINKSNHTNGLSIDLQMVNMKKRLNRNVEVTLYRIAQELISNIVRHANASEAHIQLVNHGDSIVLIGEDDGVGFETGTKKSGIGLKNIISRTQLLKGEVFIDSAEGKGTVITVEIPLN